MALRRPFLHFFMGFLLFCTLYQARAQTTGDLHYPSTPLPYTTTLEPEINPRGLMEPPHYGWHTDFIGPWRGYFDLSIGVKAWSDRFTFQNLIFGGFVDLLPGLRARLEFRKRDNNKFAQVIPDEFYLEAYDRYRGHHIEGGVSLRIGHVRYLHFPFPDAIALFDTVPDNRDLYISHAESDYRSIVLEGEVASYGGWGAHWTGRAAGFSPGDNPKGTVIEAYAFYRTHFGNGWRFETRAGDLAVRRYPVGQPGEPGYNVYLGKQIGEFNVGLFYEHKRSEHDFTGVAVQFRPGPVTRVFGRYDIDYSRRPEGITAQIPLLHLRLNEHKQPRHGDVLVGQVRAVRIRTLDVQGLVRNEYEFRLESWGQTSGPEVRCVVREEPWYLQAEALVSPHTSLDSRWFHDRAGPGQYVQVVTYDFFKPKPPAAETNTADEVPNAERLARRDTDRQK
jgi:hypothetical protein